MDVVERPLLLASGLSVVAALEAVKGMKFGFLGANTFHWCRLHSVIPNTQAEACWRLVNPFVQMLEAKVTRLRALLLFPTGKIPKHSDPVKGVLHVVLSTNDYCVLRFEGSSDVRTQVGDAWLLPASKPHEGWNAGSSVRVHLVADLL